LLYINKATKPVIVPPTIATPGLTLNNSIYNHPSIKIINTACKTHKTKRDNKKIFIYNSSWFSYTQSAIKNEINERKSKIKKIYM